MKTEPMNAQMNESATYESNINWVRGMIRKKFRHNKDVENLIGVGSLALLKAMRNYDPSKGGSFFSYANTVVYREVEAQVTKDSRFNNQIAINYDGDYLGREDNTLIIEDARLRLKQAGYNYNEIAERMGESRETSRRLCREAAARELIVFDDEDVT